MIRYSVQISAQARRDSTAIYHWIADANSPEIARRFVEGVLHECETLSIAPHRGTPRSSAGREFRTIGYKRTVTIVFSASGTTVHVLRLLYRGRNESELLQG